jgi:hypothetical protein
MGMLAILAACGGGGTSGTGGGDGGGGGGGGGNGNAPSISLLSPSMLMVGVPLGGATVFGANFTPDAQVFLDGTAAPVTDFRSSGELDVEIPDEVDFKAQVHQFTVHQSSGTSNSVSFTVYNPARGPQPFAAISGYDPGGSDSSGMTVADVNGDGLADAVMQGPIINGGPSLTVMLGQANGEFGPPIITPGLFAGVMVAGDVNGDGSADIVSATLDAKASPVISVLLNDGKGNFRQSSTIPYVGNFPGSLTLADVDGDGKPDLLFSAANPSAIYFLRNLGGGSFAGPVLIATPAGDNRTLAVGDFNGDGRPDIVYAFLNPATNQDQIHLLLNQGGGTFSDQVPAGIPVPGSFFAVGDFNHDGHADIAVDVQISFLGSMSAGVTVFLGQGNGSFTAGPTTVFDNTPFLAYQLVAGDFDGDGNLDLAGVDGGTRPGHVSLLWGDGTGNFTPQQVNGPMGFSLMTADINGDGVTDVIIPDRFGIISVVLGQKQRIMPSGEPFYPAGVGTATAGDVNGDKKVDLYVGSLAPSPPGSLYLNQGSEKFTQAGSPPGQGILLADLDGDGFADLIGSDGVNLLVWKGAAGGSFSSTPIPIGPPPSLSFQAPQIQIADMDGDGRPDIIMPNVVLYNQGNLNFVAVTLNFGAEDGPFVVGDFNHDGLMDIVTGAATLLGQANRTFRTVTPNNLNIGPGNFPAVGDFNKDGNLDVVYSGNGLPIVVYYGRGDGTFYEQSLLTIGPVSDFSQSIAVGDFNGDGLPDILACLFLSQQCAVYTNNGHGGFERSYFASGTSSIAVLTTDLKGDGKSAVVASNFFVDFAPPNFNVIFHQ